MVLLVSVRLVAYSPSTVLLAMASSTSVTLALGFDFTYAPFKMKLLMTLLSSPCAPYEFAASCNGLITIALSANSYPSAVLI